ncbi:LuxR family transcriptional regulator [Nonomuraea sp. LPB2021202275-12-8]|uniref:LuxR family transcriptional regulator n=1 Tax=Nonomuraea sp. LPB2021202275-12-8 TaxID=3120159 RepID=UPI00300C5123
MFVGRMAELALLRAELSLARVGPARKVVIEGPEGIGKTALIRHVLDEAADVRVLAASGEENERQLRFGLVRQLTDEVAGQDTWTVGQAICDVIERSQAGGPVVVLVDDAQWADRPSLRALGYALRRLRGGRVLVLIACRDIADPWLPEGLRRLLAADATRRLCLGGLSAGELARLPVLGRPGAGVMAQAWSDGAGWGTRDRFGDAGARPLDWPGGVGAGSLDWPGGGGAGSQDGLGGSERVAGAGSPPRGDGAGPGEPAREGGGSGQAGGHGREGSGEPGHDPSAGVPEPSRAGSAFSGRPLSERAAARLHAHTLGNPLHARAMLATFPVSLLADPGTRLPAPETYARPFIRRLRSCEDRTRALIAACAVLDGHCTLFAAATVSRALPGTAARGRPGHPRGGTASRGTRLVARVGAELGDESEAGIAAEGDPVAGGAGAAASAGDEVLDALEEAVAAGLLVELPGRVIAFPDPLARAAVYGRLGAGTRARLHLAAARFVDDTGTALRHRAAAAGGPDEVLAEELGRFAAKEAQHGLWHDAATHLELAAGLTESAVRRDELRTAALEHVLLGGDAVRAAELAAAPNVDPRPVRRYVLGRLALAWGRLDEAGRLLADAWPHREPGFAADTAEQLAWLHLLRHDRQEAARWARLAIEQPIQGAAARPFDVLALSGEPCPGAPADSVARAVGLLRDDHVDEARAVLGRTVAALGKAGLPHHRLLAVALLAVAEYRDGRWADAVERAERAVAEAGELGQRWLLPCLRVVCVAPLAAQGEQERALAHAGAARSVARRQHNALGEAQADLAMALLGAGAAAPAVADAFAPDPRPQLVETFVAEGALDEAEAVLAGMDAAGAGPRARAQRARLGGLLLAARNVPTDAEESFAAALALVEAGACPMEEARVLLDLGRLLRRTGRRRAAAERLQAARAIFAWLGARPLVARCAQELEACGLEPAVTARLGLTPQEFSTATLVADGLTNRQIARELLISVKTVEYHIGKIYIKLGIGSRVALAAKLAEYGENPRSHPGAAGGPLS